jgi:hypothetical protein
MSFPSDPAPNTADPVTFRQQIDIYVAVAKLSERVSHLIDLVKNDQRERATERKETAKALEEIDARLKTLEDAKLIQDARIGVIWWAGGVAFAILLAVIGAGAFFV